MFAGGLTLYESSEHTCYRLLGTDFINISFGQRGLQNSKRTGPDTPSKTPKNIQNRTNNASQQSAINLKGKDTKSDKTTSKNGFQPQKNNPWKKDQNATKDADKSNDCNGKQPNPEIKKGNNEQTRNLKVHHPKQQSKSILVDSNVPNNMGDCKQEAENNRDKSNGISENTPESNSTGTRPKKPFIKKNIQKADNDDKKRKEKSVHIPNFNNKTRTRPKEPSNKKNGSRSQGRVNPYPCNTNSNENTPSEVTK